MYCWVQQSADPLVLAQAGRDALHITPDVGEVDPGADREGGAPCPVTDLRRREGRKTSLGLRTGHVSVTKYSLVWFHFSFASFYSNG